MKSTIWPKWMEHRFEDIQPAKLQGHWKIDRFKVNRFFDLQESLTAKLKAFILDSAMRIQRFGNRKREKFVASLFSTHTKI